MGESENPMLVFMSRRHVQVALFFFLIVLAFTVPVWSGSREGGKQGSEKMAGATRLFLSGHSLTDDPLASNIAAIGASLRKPIDWQQQMVIGAPIRWRTKGDTKIPGSWPGYSYGKNRGGQSELNVLREFEGIANQGKNGTEKKYDTLVIAEGHYSVAGLIWNNTVRYLRHYHERFIEQNHAGQTYLFESWESIRNKSKPEPWIDLELAAASTWGCVVKRINVSLEHEGRTDRLKSLPTASALAELISEAIDGHVPGVSAQSPRATVDRLVRDDVHLTPVGVYYISLFSYAVVTGTSPVGAWYPPEVTSEQAAALQKFAWSVRERNEARGDNKDLPACRKWMTETFCDKWNFYLPEKDGGRLGHCKDFFVRDDLEKGEYDNPNPFVFDAKKDGEYWYQAP